MREFHFDLAISATEYLAYYRGDVQQVMVRALDGSKVQFPARLLMPFVTTVGVRGRFVLTCDNDGRGARLVRRA
ncbi:MAG: DUF2835 family protein [Rhodoferax sp.]|nr:MAG: DUF2835 family protein [Rhodoferax sp.]